MMPTLAQPEVLEVARRTAQFILAAMLAIVAGTAAASDWQPVATSESGTYSMDFASLVRDGTVVRAWVRITLNKPMDGPAGIKVLSARSRQYFDCENRRWAHKQSTFYADKQFEKVARDGEEVEDALLDWNQIPPDHANEILLEVACAKAPPK